MKRILIAVQDDALAVFLSEALMEEAYEVIICSNILCLLRIVKRAKPHLILMDEGFGGSQFTILYKNIASRLKETPLIILWRGNHPVSCKMDSKIEGFVLKGFNLIDLKRKIAGVLEGEPFHSGPEHRLSERVPLTQTEFRWSRAN